MQLKENEINDFDGVVIVGAGLVGSLAALTLAKRGCNVLLVERSEDWEEISKKETIANQQNSTLKRSINLALSHRGQMALRRVGILEEVMEFAIPMHCRAIHTSKDRASCEADFFQPYDEIDSSNYINSISRERLNRLLVAKAREESDRVHVLFGVRLSHVDKSGVAHFEDRPEMMQGASTFNDYTKGRIQIRPKLILGCDGAHSPTRESMLRLQTMDIHKQYISHGYKELTIPATKDGKFALNTHEALHIWPRGEFMMIGLPNPDSTFTCTIFAPFHTTVSDSGVVVPGLLDVKTDAQIKEYFATHFPDVIGVMPDYVEQFKSHPSCRLMTVKTSPWNLKDKMLIIGDAAHAIVPFYGQGMNAGFEDILELDLALDKCDGDLARAVPIFAETRMPHGHAIGDLSLRNYIEMRDHTASKVFLLKKKIEGVLNYMFPTNWVPLYKMVAFTRTPYQDAIDRDAKQQKILSIGIKSLAVLGVVGLAHLFMGRGSGGCARGRCGWSG